MKGKDMKNMDNCDCMSHNSKWIGACLLLLGAVVLLNDYYNWLTWPVFIGALIILKGLKVLMMPKYKCC
ncbi:MAG: hypothetical protein AABX17_02575 [Nanoarchaeota archaeon]